MPATAPPTAKTIKEIFDCFDRFRGGAIVRDGGRRRREHARKDGASGSGSGTWKGVKPSGHLRRRRLHEGSRRSPVPAQAGSGRAQPDGKVQDEVTVSGTLPFCPSSGLHATQLVSGALEPDVAPDKARSWPALSCHAGCVPGGSGPRLQTRIRRLSVTRGHGHNRC